MTGVHGWGRYAAPLVVLWGIWGAVCALPATWYGYPDEMIYTIWALTMIAPALFALRGRTFDRRLVATGYGLSIGLTGAGGQLLLFWALVNGPAYVVFPIVALSPVVTVLLAVAFLRERVSALTVLGLTAALSAALLFSLTRDDIGQVPVRCLFLAAAVSVLWGVQTYLMRKSAVVGVDASTTFGWMTIGALALIPAALMSLNHPWSDASWLAPALTAGIQLLNAAGALLLVLALHRGKATVVAPVVSALAPVLTIAVSLVAAQRIPGPHTSSAIMLAVTGSALLIYGEHRRGPV